MTLIGRENACEHGCPARAVRTVPIFGRPFRFCNHHANRVEAALSDQMEPSEVQTVG